MYSKEKPANNRHTTNAKSKRLCKKIAEPFGFQADSESADICKKIAEPFTLEFIWLIDVFEIIYKCILADKKSFFNKIVDFGLFYTI